MGHFQIASEVAAPCPEVWQRVISPEGVNDELWPIRMTFPDSAEHIGELPLGKDLFCSRVRLWGVIPLDWHWLGLERVEPARGFAERSRTLWLAQWVHMRTLDDVPGGCRVTDRLEWQARLPGCDRLLGMLYRAIFRRRHRRLKTVFGALAPAALA